MQAGFEEPGRRHLDTSLGSLRTEMRAKVIEKNIQVGRLTDGTIPENISSRYDQLKYVVFSGLDR